MLARAMRRALALVFAFAFAVALVASFPARAADVTYGVPKYAVGDAWEWIGNGTSPNATASARMHTEVIAAGKEFVIRQITISNTTAFTNVSLDLTSWYRADDGALVRSYQYSRAENATGHIVESRLTTTYVAPCTERAYPLHVGQTWRISCTATIVGKTNGLDVNTSEIRNETVTIGNDTSVDVGGRSFPALTAVLQDGSHKGDAAVYHPSPTVCNDAAISATRRNIVTHFEIAAWRCAASGSSGGNFTMQLPPLPPDEPPIAVPPRSLLPFASPALVLALAFAVALAVAGKRK